MPLGKFSLIKMQPAGPSTRTKPQASYQVMELPLILLQSLLLLPFFLLLLKTFLLNPKTKLTREPKLPPGPGTLPFIGNIHQLIGGDLPHRRLWHLSNNYGPLFHLKLGQIHYIIASSSAAAHEILKTHDLSFAFRPALMIVKTVAYNCAGLGFSPYGPYWRQLRRICAMEVLSNKRVKSFVSIREEEAAKVVSMIRAGGGSTEVNLTEVFLGLTNNHLTRAAFGKECESRDRFLKAMKETIKLSPVLSLMDLFPSLAPVISKVDGKMKRMRKLHVEMDEILDEIIQEHKGRKGVGVEDMEEDLVDVLLRVKDNGELEIPLSMIDIKAVIMDLLVAATETTSSTMSWVLSELIRNPEVMYKVQLEIREAAKEKTRIEECDIKELHYLRLVIKETLRLHPPLPLLLPRTCNESVELSGFIVPSKSRVMVNAWAIGRDPNVWEDPESFLPDRFNGSAVDFNGGSFEYIPFGSGRRICPGMTFAIVSMELFLAVLLFHFDWKLPSGRSPEELDMEEEFDGSLRRKNDLCLLAVPYS